MNRQLSQIIYRNEEPMDGRQLQRSMICRSRKINRQLSQIIYRNEESEHEKKIR